MKSIILCEGSSDFILLQYYMRTVNQWEHDKNNKIRFTNAIVRNCVLTKADNMLCIAGCGGCSRIIPALSSILDRNSISAENEAFDNIIIITDRDELDTEDNFIRQIERVMGNYNVQAVNGMENDIWAECTYINGQGKKKEVKLLLLVIPFEQTGAMETFLLNAVSENDEYDAGLIEKCNNFVDMVDEEKRYLTKRRYVTKAKFDVYFSIRTSAEQFVERQNILKSVPWEKYMQIQKSFDKLSDL